MSTLPQFGVCKPCEHFEHHAGDPELTQDYLQKFGDCEDWSIHLVARKAFDLPRWVEAITWRDPVHLFISLRDPNGKEITQIHGLPFDRKTGEQSIVGDYDDTIKAVFDRRMGREIISETELWRGKAKDFAAKIANAASAGNTINKKDYKYRPYLPFFEGRNSNSVAREMIEAMGLKIPAHIKAKWWNIWDRVTSLWAPGVVRGAFNRVSRAQETFDHLSSLPDIFAKGFQHFVTALSPGMVRASVLAQNISPGKNTPNPALPALRPALG